MVPDPTHHHRKDHMTSNSSITTSIWMTTYQPYRG